MAVVAAGAIVYHRALQYGFSQDDFVGLGRAAGLVPRIQGPWRWLGNQAIFDLMRPLAGLTAAPYHVASLLVHVACGLLLLLFLRRRFSLPAATLAAIFFVTNPMIFTGVYWISVIADSLALAFAIGTLGALDEDGRARWLAVPLFALSLLAKESTILLPLAAAFTRRTRREGSSIPPWRDPVLLVMVGTSAGYALYFMLSAYGTYFLAPHSASDDLVARTSAAYAVGLGPHVGANLFSYLAWTVNLWFPTVRSFSDAVDPHALPWALGLILAWLVGFAIPALRRHGWLAGGALYLLLLLPVLGLRHHTYHYYLYAPLLGAAWCLAALVDPLFRSAGRPAPARAPAKKGAPEPGPDPRRLRIAWAGAGAFAVLLTMNGYALVERIETMPYLDPSLRSDPIVDRARIASQVRRSLALAALPAGTRLAFWSPIAAAGNIAPADSESYLEKNVRSALVGGLAVRLLFPVVQDVVFVHTYRPLPHPWLYAVYRPDGDLKVATSAELDSVLKSYERGPR